MQACRPLHSTCVAESAACSPEKLQDKCCRFAFIPRYRALLAEGLHSFADVANQLLLKHGVIRSRRKPTRQHQYGFREWLEWIWRGG